MSSQVEQIKDRIGIADVVGSYIKLEKAGGNYKARCPFHNEKTPSFFLSPARNTYYCFGCGAKGDIFSFVQEFEGLDFVGALKVLAQRAGVELTKEDPKLRTERQRLFLCLESATIFFQRNLYERAEQKPVVDYLLGRGLTTDTIKEWRVGYAPDEWRALSEYLKEKRFTESDMEKVGLIKKKESAASSGAAGGSPDYYDRFRGRIIFPLFDSSGRVIGFSGRIFKDDGKSAKYLNSPETVLFSKSHILYGFHKAKQAIREQDFSILVEGQMDLLMSQQAGFHNTVAVSGTALTVEHLTMLRRLSEKVVMVFDPDGAGVKAALRSAEIALGLGMEVKVASLPKGEDPALFILHHPDKWKEVISKALNIVEFSLDHIVSQGLEPRALAKEVSLKVLPFIARMQSSMERSHFVSMVYKKTGIKEEAVQEDLVKIGKSIPVAEKSPPTAGKSTGASIVVKTALPRRDAIERKIAGILLWQNGIEKAGGKQEVTIESVAEKAAELSAGLVTKDHLTELLERFTVDKDELVLEAELSFEKSDLLAEGLQELIVFLVEDHLKNALTDALAALSKAERSKDKDRTAELLQKCRSISDTLAKLPKFK